MSDIYSMLKISRFFRIFLSITLVIGVLFSASCGSSYTTIKATNEEPTQSDQTTDSLDVTGLDNK